MARRFYVVSYDVTDDKRRDRAFHLLMGYGDHMQYSVFCCQLSARERVQMRAALKDVLDLQEDQALILDAGPVEGTQPNPDLDYVGQPYVVRPRCQIV